MTQNRIAIYQHLVSGMQIYTMHNKSKFISCNHTAASVAASTWKFGPMTKIFPICESATFCTYRYHHRSIHQWAFWRSTRGIIIHHSIIPQISSWDSFIARMINTSLRKILDIRGRYLPHIECQESERKYHY